jgi:hypothetical protein
LPKICHHQLLSLLAHKHLPQVVVLVPQVVMVLVEITHLLAHYLFHMLVGAVQEVMERLVVVVVVVEVELLLALRLQPTQPL